MGTVPFHTVYIHPKILDGNGMTMSKSKGNGVDPMDIEKKYGTDALRFVMASLCTDNQDVRLPVKKEKQEDGTIINTSEKFEIGRNFSNKIWNACRFLYPHLKQAGALSKDLLPMDSSLFTLEDRWILSRLQTTIKDATRMLEEYHFAELAGFLYRFVWDDVCSQYLEIKKAVINRETLDAEKKNAMAILSHVLRGVIDLLHPVMPFITEELNATLFPGSERVIHSPWPKADESLINADIEKAFVQAFAVVESVRGVRGRYKVAPAKKLTAVVSVDDAATEKSIKDCEAIITELGGIESFTVGVKAAKPKFSASAVVPGGELYIPLEGILDPKAEIERL
jgi:valyl-tRNA synthetase